MDVHVTSLDITSIRAIYHIQEKTHFTNVNLSFSPEDFPTELIHPLPLNNKITLKPHLEYSINRNGTRRYRHFCDGSKIAAPTLRELILAYSLCV